MQHCTVNGLGDTMFRLRSLESCLRSKDSRAVWRGAVGKGPQGTSLAAYPTARPVLNGGREETCRKVTRLAPTQLECGFLTLQDRQGAQRLLVISQTPCRFP